MGNYKENRNFMKSSFDEDLESDQKKLISQPPLEKPYNGDAKPIDLPNIDKSIVKKKDIYDCFIDRASHRKYKEESLTLEELSYLLYITQGVKRIKGDNYATIRPVPSAGARHPYETYIAANRVYGLNKGVYRYLPIEHKLLSVKEENDIEQRIIEGAHGQKFVGTAAVNFIWSCIPYRGEWRYVNRAHKYALIDVGHICQNLYLACETIGLGTCGIGSYEQQIMNEIVGVDGKDEFVVYMAPVGRVL